MSKLLKHSQKGFTLVEVSITLALVTVMTMYLLSPMSMWMAKSADTETERKMQDIKAVLTRYYSDNAMAIDNAAVTNPTSLGVWTTNAPAAGAGCPTQVASFRAIDGGWSDSPESIANDGYKNPWCFFISPPLTAIRNGVTLTYRNIAVVSTGTNGILDAGTGISGTGALVLSPTGDDKGILVSGLDIQHKKLLGTMDKMQRIANLYETYFTTQYLANASRDMSINYFNNQWHTAGTIGSSNGTWAPSATLLANIGIGGTDGFSEWEINSDIEIGNYTESVNGVTVRTPQTTGTAAYPYTAMLRARVPGTSGQYVSKIVVGNY